MKMNQLELNEAIAFQTKLAAYTLDVKKELSELARLGACSKRVVLFTDEHELWDLCKGDCSISDAATIMIEISRATI